MNKFNDLALEAVAHQKNNQFIEAKKIYQKLIEINPKEVQILRLYSMVEYALKNFDSALKLINECIKINPENSEAYSNRAIINLAINNISEAQSDYEKAIKKNPNNHHALFNLGNLYKKKKDYKNALKFFDKAIFINKNLYKAYHNKGVVKNLERKFDEAIEEFDKAISIKPDYANSLFFKSMIQLQKGDYIAGFKNFEYRWNTTNFPSIKRNFIKPYWDGKQDIKDKTILLHGEQGLGDQLQYVRYLDLVKKTGAKVILEIDKRLFKLFEESKQTKEIYSQGDKLPYFDFHCPLMSLPLKFSTTINTIPSKKKYISSKTERVQKWKKFFDPKKINVGVTWQSSNNDNIDKGRNFELNNFTELSLIKNVELYSLQKLTGTDQLRNQNKDKDLKINIFDSNFDEEASFIDTAAVIENLDLVITLDSAMPHLAGALGCETWLLLQKYPHWTWMLDKKNSPWYPNLFIYRQSIEGDWKSVFTDIKRDLITKFVK
tara:strand:- start:88 stop:1560 length:1473 start_codon:yes stop_codon:yes gene_type:complete